jgi:Na+/H+-dicarboxylate symporter
LLGGVFLAIKAKQNLWQILIGFIAGVIVGHLWW